MNDRESEFIEAALDTTGRDGKYESLASRALSLVAARRLEVQPEQIGHHVSALARAVTDADPALRRAVMDDIRTARFTEDDIAERIIPEVARLLGERWCSDQQSFAEVTIGAARLQGMLRDLSPPRDIGEAGDRAAPVLAIVVMSDETHTLGAMVLARYLRRHGASVRLIIGKPDHDVLRHLDGGGFDAVLFSVATAAHLPRVKSLAGRIKGTILRNATVLVGGYAVDTVAEAKRLSGADHAVSDPQEALELCGLTTFQRAGKRRETLE